MLLYDELLAILDVEAALDSLGHLATAEVVNGGIGIVESCLDSLETSYIAIEEVGSCTTIGGYVVSTSTLDSTVGAVELEETNALCISLAKNVSGRGSIYIGSGYVASEVACSSGFGGSDGKVVGAFGCLDYYTRVGRDSTFDGCECYLVVGK